MNNSIEHLIRPNIRKLIPYSSARDEFKGQADIFLDANENPFPTGLNRYPDPLQKAVKKELAALKKVDEAQIFLGNGSDEVIDLLIRIFCEPQQDHIIQLPPTYGMYRVCADIANVAVVDIPLNKRFLPDVPAILAKASAQSKLLFLCSPNNPSGNSFALSDIQALAAEFPGIVVVDEAYIDFSAQASCLGLLDQCPNLVVMQTFSKAWGMAGIRLGMAFASPAIIQLFNKVKPPYNINQLTQQTVLQALKKAAQKEAWVKQIISERSMLQHYLGSLDYIERIYPSDANFILVKMQAPRRVYDFLMEQGIIVRDRSNVLLCEGCLRITIGTPEENEKLFEALVQFS
ncbi:MAG TPA: histidinol-phosphate transaminase [Saprospiraceae bacterium]|nr:histidinol-phosphate transaminase [Saprospiraceae bacterium]HMQ83680.1 histidinol-phosphate transaminase [Saprospiraceae bacterium]